MVSRKCALCDNLYICNRQTGLCHAKMTVKERDCELECDDFIVRYNGEIPRLMDDIALLLSQGKEAVLLDNGSPSMRFNNRQPPNEVELVLRVTCNPSHDYHVVEG